MCITPCASSGRILVVLVVVKKMMMDMMMVAMMVVLTCTSGSLEAASSLMARCIQAGSFQHTRAEAQRDTTIIVMVM